MNAKVSLWELKMIIRDTPPELKGQSFKEHFGYQDYERIGWYQKKNANWIYFIYAVKYPSRYKDIMLIATIGDIIE